MGTQHTGWVGWFRPSKSADFQAICTAASENECWSRLLQAVQVHGCDKVVLPQSRNPNDERMAAAEHRRRIGRRRF
jgi:hypothetical protein